MDTIFEHKAVYTSMWHQDALGRNTVINFVVVLSKLLQYVLDTQVTDTGADTEGLTTTWW